jgi:hypothetical protein
MQIEEFWRIPFPVKGVQVTEENMQEVANWCRGKVNVEAVGTVDNASPRRFIKVKVEKAITDKQTRARVGDYVLRSPSGFKVYTEQAFLKCFGQKREEVLPYASPDEPAITPVDGPDVPAVDAVSVQED